MAIDRIAQRWSKMRSASRVRISDGFAAAPM
jgi:hypothetical protein